MLMLELHEDAPDNYQQAFSVVIPTAIINLHVHGPLKHEHWADIM